MDTPSHPRLPMQQEVRFCTTRDGVRIAYATVGSGPPLVKAANWLNHLEFDWQSPIWRHLFAELTEHHTLIRYDERGNGLSDWNVADLSFESLVADLEAVVEASGARRFALFGVSQGGPVAIAYAVRHPERVSQLVLHGSYAKGWAKRADIREREGREALVTLIRQGWGQDNPVFRQMWSTLYIPDGSREQVDWFNELQRITTSPEIAERLVKVLSDIDVADLLPRVQAPTLVTHCRGDSAVPFEAGRAMAARIPGAKFVELPGRNHLLLEGMPEWDRFRDEVRAFLGDPRRSAAERAISSGSSSRLPASESVATRDFTGQPTASAQWQPGDERAHYRILSALGAGGMGVVYRARDTRLERDVAVKVLPDALSADPAARARLNREAQAASALNHPNICTIYEVGEAAGHAYIAMEYVEGRTLASAIPREGMPVDSVIRYGEQMADALAHAHDRNVLHRDLKSANVIITREGRAKILDFGLAKRIGAEIDAATLSQVSPLTQAGSIAGTLHYLPPEVLRGEPADARGDIWALGVVLYEMASGKRPFEGRTSFEVTSAILREALPALPAGVTPGLRAVIQRCLAKEPTQRYQRASEVRAALEAIGSGTSPVAALPGVPASAHEPGTALGTWSLRIVGLVAALVLIASLAGQWDSWRRERDSASQQTAPANPAAPVAGEARLSTGGKPSASPEANAYFEKAMLFLSSKFDLPTAHGLLAKALEADPKFAHARAMYGFTHLMHVDSGLSTDRKWISQAQAEVQRALQDDPESPTGRTILAALYMTQGRRELAVPELQRALQAEPDLTPANMWMIFADGMAGNSQAALARADRLRKVQPLFFPAQIVYGKILHESGDKAEAVRIFRGVLDQDPTNQYALADLARGHVESGDTATARMLLEKIPAAQRQNNFVRLQWALLYAREGKRREALRELNAGAQRFAELIPRSTATLAAVYARLGEIETAMDWVDRAVENGDERIEWFQRDPLLANLQEHPRFKQIVASVEFRRTQRK